LGFVREGVVITRSITGVEAAIMALFILLVFIAKVREELLFI
jgi:hypothetical protein